MLGVNKMLREWIPTYWPGDGQWTVGVRGGWWLGVGPGGAVYTVYAPILLAPGAVLIKCSNFQRSLLARSISDLSVLATRGAYVFIFSIYVVCCLYVKFLLPPERATKAGPCHLFFYILIFSRIYRQTGFVYFLCIFDNGMHRLYSRNIKLFFYLFLLLQFLISYKEIAIHP